MSEVKYRGNLSASSFPLVSKYQGRTIIVPSIDQSYIRGLQIPQDGLVNENDRGIPQILYAHNVMPDGEGFQSVGFLQRNDNPIGGGSIPDDAVEVRCVDAFGINAFSGVMYCFCSNTATVKSYRGTKLPSLSWNPVTVAAPNDVYTGFKSVAYINGKTYIHCLGSAVPLRLADFSVGDNLLNSAFIGMPLTGGAKGITAAYGYMIAWNDVGIAWSSLTNEIDFTPSLVTGASSIRLQDQKGAIILCVPHELGFLIFCQDNALSATYTGNKLQPWLFKEISDCGGMIPISNLYPQSYVTSDTTSDQYYMYNKSGLQNVGSRQAISILPDISDFLAGNVFEDYDTIARTFTETDIGTTKLVSSLTFVGNRYLVISYGLPPVGSAAVSFTHALVYDSVNKRLGKLKFTHIICFEAPAVSTTNPIGIGNPTPRDRIHFINTAGDVYSVDFNSVVTVNLDAVLMLGKFQLQRNDSFQLEDIQLENVQAGGLCDCYVYTQLDGKNPDVVSGTAATLKLAAANLRRWAFHKTGVNHVLAFIGAFYASSIQITGHNNGKR